MSPTRCRLPVHNTCTWLADFRHSGKPSTNTSGLCSLKSLESRPRETQIRQSEMQLKVTVGIGPLSEWWWGSGDVLTEWWSAAVCGPEMETADDECRLVMLDLEWDERRSSQTERLSAHRRSWPSSVTFMSIRSVHHHHHHHHQQQQQQIQNF